MSMTRTTIAFLLAAAVAMPSAAEEDADAATVEKPAEAESAKDASEMNPGNFTTLPACRFAEGQAEVRKPGSAEWELVEEGRFYPLGSSFRTIGAGRMKVAFGLESMASISGDSSFGTRQQPLGEKTRAILLERGTVELSLPRNMKEGLFFVSAPSFTVRNPAGESKFTYEDLGDGDAVTVRCVTGALALGGRHFDVPSMHAANEVKIRSSRDYLETILYGTSGDYVVKIDRGLVSKTEIGDDGTVRNVSKKDSLEWHLSPATKVRINRAVPSIGERMSVAVMTFDAAGELKNNFAFAEDRAEVNTGELVVAPKNEGDLAKRAAEAAEATETAPAADVEEAPAAQSSESSSSGGDSENNE